MRFQTLIQAAGVGAAMLIATAGSAFAITTIDSAVDVMAGPSSNSHIVARLAANTNVSVTSQQDSWCKVSAPGSLGWVPCSDVTGLPSASTTPTGPQGYDFNTDPNFGPAVQGGIHSVHQGNFG